jgi:hypothetical protein
MDLENELTSVRFKSNAEIERLLVLAHSDHQRRDDAVVHAKGSDHLSHALSLQLMKKARDAPTHEESPRCTERNMLMTPRNFIPVPLNVKEEYVQVIEECACDPEPPVPATYAADDAASEAADDATVEAVDDAVDDAADDAGDDAAVEADIDAAAGAADPASGTTVVDTAPDAQSEIESLFGSSVAAAAEEGEDVEETAV